MNVVILCGGRGARLAGLWDRAKCLVPLGDGRPIIEHLIQRTHALKPHRIILVTGYCGDEVAVELRRRGLLHPRLIVFREAKPAGTANALRAVGHLLDEAYTLVLNGDTLPLYDLRDLWRRGAPLDTHWRVIRATCGAKPAGVTLLGPDKLRLLMKDTQYTDFDEWIGSFSNAADAGIHPVFVRGFLDVGTPEGFALAKSWMVEEKI